MMRITAIATSWFRASGRNPDSSGICASAANSRAARRRLEATGRRLPPTLDNIDTDGDLELVIGTVSSGVVAYDLPRPQAALLVQNMAAKEFGHVLGLKGHSPVPGDLMYPELRHDVAQLPTGRDLETLRQLYNRPPNIVLNYH